jgi:hypothetical protein
MQQDVQQQQDAHLPAQTQLNLQGCATAAAAGLLDTSVHIQ